MCKSKSQVPQIADLIEDACKAAQARWFALDNFAYNLKKVESLDHCTIHQVMEDWANDIQSAILQLQTKINEQTPRLDSEIPNIFELFAHLSDASEAATALVRYCDEQGYDACNDGMNLEVVRYVVLALVARIGGSMDAVCHLGGLHSVERFTGGHVSLPFGLHHVERSIPATVAQ